MKVAGITFRSLGGARPTAKIGVRGQLTALSKLNLQPNMAPTCKAILGKIAQGEIIFPASLLPMALTTIHGLTSHDRVGSHAQAAFSIVAVETLIQARDHQTLHKITIDVLEAVKKAEELQIAPELIDEAADAIEALIAVDTLKAFTTPALEVLRPTPAGPVTTPPTMPTEAVQPEVNTVLMIGIAQNKAGTLQQGIDLFAQGRINLDVHLTNALKSKEPEVVLGTIKLIAEIKPFNTVAQASLEQLAFLYLWKETPSSAKQQVIAVMQQNFGASKEMIDLVQNVAAGLSRLNASIKTLRASGQNNIASALDSSRKIFFNNFTTLLRELAKNQTLSSELKEAKERVRELEAELATATTVVATDENVIDLTIPADDTNQVVAGFEQEIVEIEEQKEELAKALVGVRQQAQEAGRKEEQYTLTRIPEMERVRDEYFQLVNQTLTRLLDEAREQTIGPKARGIQHVLAELDSATDQDSEAADDPFWNSHLAANKEDSERLTAQHKQLKGAEEELETIIGELDAAKVIGTEQIQTIQDLLKVLLVNDREIADLISSIEASNQRITLLETKARPYLATLQVAKALLKSMEEELIQAVAELEEHKFSLIGTVNNEAQRKSRDTFDLVAGWKAEFAAREQAANELLEAKLARLTALRETLKSLEIKVPAKA